MFPASKVGVDTWSGEQQRHHLHESVLQRAVREATRQADITRLVSCHALPPSFATQLPVLNRGGRTVYSPIDPL